MLFPLRRTKLESQQPQEVHVPDVVTCHEAAWVKMPIALRRRAVDHLSKIDDQFFDDLRQRVAEHGLNEWMPPFWHFGQGMGFRNHLREVIRDEELPGLPEVYGEDYGGNWDDYYVPCLEAAAGLRPIGDEDAHAE